jgi:hypothetical protein
MLADWYFCCSMRSEPADAAIFLSIVDCLEDSLVSGQNAPHPGIALSELDRMDIWMQIYALPTVLKLIGHQDLDIGTQARDYFTSIAASLPEDVESSFSGLLKDVLSANTSTIRSTLRVCVKSLSTIAGRQPSIVPYLDLKEFLAETMLLAVVESQLSRDGSLANLFSDSTADDSIMFQRVLDAALRHERGRLAFRLALRIALRIEYGGYSVEQLESMIWQNPSADPEHEPDLLASWAEVVFSKQQDSEGQSMASRLINESQTLAHLRYQLTERRRRPAREGNGLANQFLRATAEEVDRSLTIVFWQSTLWELAAKLDATMAAVLLASLWRQPARARNDLVLRCPSSQYARNEIQEELYQLVRLRNISGIKLCVSPGPRIESNEACWVIFSPWLELNKDGSALDRSNQGLPKYPCWPQLAVQIRLIAAAVASTWLLLRLSPEDPIRASFASLMVHAYDVFRAAQVQAVPQRQMELQSTRVPKPMVALAMYARSRIRQAGGCDDDRLKPEMFMVPLRTRAEDARSRLSYDGVSFRDSILPSVLMSWIAETYTSAIRGRGSLRWLKLIPELYDQQGKQELWYLIQNELIARFLAADLKGSRNKRPDWRKKGTWGVNHRVLLLTPELPADEWHRPEWKEHKEPRMLLVRALERLGATANCGDLPIEIVEQWKTEWSERLSGVNKPGWLDTFVLLRLLELLRSPTLSHDIEGQNLITLTLLEYGSLYELERLFDLYFPASEPEWSVVPSEAVREVRIALLNAIFYEVNRRDERRLFSLEPWVVRLRVEKERLIRNTLRRVAYFNPKWNADFHRQRIAEALIACYERLNREQLSVVRHVEAEVELSGQARFLVVSDSQRMQEWRVRSVAFDPNMLTGKIVLEDWDEDEFYDLFSMSPEEVRDFAARRQSGYVIACVISVFFRDDIVDLALNCGFRDFLHLERRGRQFRRGQWILVPINWRTDRPEVDPERDLYRIPLRRVAGRIERLRLREYQRDRMRDLEMSIGRDNIQLTVSPQRESTWCERSVWYSNFARILRGRSIAGLLQCDREVYAELGEQGDWQPLTRRLEQLLIHPEAFKEGMAILCFVDFLLEAFGWRFALDLGEFFTLLPEDFESSSYEKLEQELRGHQDPSGLLVAVVPDYTEGTVKLRIAEERQEVSPFEYQDLVVPFDKRNIEWRNLFARSNSEVAYNHKGNWLIEVDSPPCFPKEIRVQLYGKRDVDNDLEISVLQWDPYTATVVGEVVQTHRLSPRSEASREDFLYFWLNLRRGDRLRLSSAFGRISEEGEVLCRTEEGLTVIAEAESLSMKLLPQQGTFEIGELRTSEVIRAGWGWPRRVVVDARQLPPSVQQMGRAEGILSQVPRRGETVSSRCEVWWFVEGQAIEGNLMIENMATLQAERVVGLGSRVAVELCGDQWTVEIRQPLVKVRGLWSVIDRIGSKQRLTYLGEVEIDNAIRSVAEQEPGTLVVFPEVLSGQRHLSEGDGVRFGNNLGELRTRNVSRGKSWLAGQREYRRATLLVRNFLLCGNCRADDPQTSILVSRVNLSLERRADDLFTLKRLLVLKSEGRAERAPAKESDVYWSSKLREYFESPSDLEGVIEQTRKLIKLTDLRVPDLAGGWSNTVSLARDEAPFITSANYSSKVRVRLFEDMAGNIQASFRMVPSLTIDGYRREMGSPDFGQTISTRLYYAGAVYSGSREGEILHRFEWGYGQTLLAPEDQLRFSDAPFRTAMQVLFMGDALTSLVFLHVAAAANQDHEHEPEEFRDEEEDGVGALPDSATILSINGLSIEPSHATSLYLQRRRFRIVHLLHLVDRPDGSLGVGSIVGMAEGSAETIWTASVDRARLSDESQRILRQRWPAKADEDEDNEPETRVILARMDDEAFRSSLGLDVVFYHVSMSFRFVPEGGRPLEQSELVFVRAGKLHKVRNDVGLQILPWRGLAQVDIGMDCADLLILRRPFSVREDLLSRMLMKGESALEGSALLVNLSEQRERVAVALWWKHDRSSGRAPSRSAASVPARKEGALRKAVAEGVVLAAVVDVSAAGIQLELRPGVFVTINRTRLEECPNDLIEGSMVRVENVGDKDFRITRATQGEDWYLDTGLRAAVGLPMNNLIDRRRIGLWDVESSSQWRGPSTSNRCFSIGSLPGIMAVPGIFDAAREEWQDPEANSFISLMKMRHPKIVVIGRDSVNRVRIQPGSGGTPVGKLSVDRAGQRVSFVAIGTGGAGPDDKSIQVDWESLSFADDSATGIAERIERELWSYHDSVTGFWTESGEVRLQESDWHSGSRGPLFFELRGSNARLRYSEANLRKFGFPSRELARSLASLQGEESDYTVAGVLPEGGLWIELAPGRIADLPAQLVVTVIEGREYSLSHLAWSAFAPGDVVRLRLITSDPVAIDRFEFKDWFPGPRRSLGNRCFLPIIEIDRERGGTRIGAGDLQMTIPRVWEADRVPSVVLLFAENYIFGASSRPPEAGDTVLLGIDERKVPIVLGFSGYEPLADALHLNAWEGDPLREYLMATQSSTLHERLAQVSSVIMAAGGVLAVTVERSLPRERRIFFSRRIQNTCSLLREGEVGKGRVVGILSDGKSALLRLGSGLLKAPVRRIIYGLPFELCRHAVETLCASRTDVWLRGGLNAALEYGLSIESGRTIQVEVVGFLSDGRKQRGILCRSVNSLSFYYIPAEESGWAALLAEELPVVFQLRQRMKVRLNGLEAGRNSVSLIALAEIQRELSSLGVGKELTVRVMGPRPGLADRIQRYLVSTLGSGVVLECEAYDGRRLEVGQEIAVEVIRRRRGMEAQPTLCVVPIGQKLYSLDLPLWILDKKRDIKALRPEFKDYLRWCQEEPILPDLEFTPMDSIEASELNRGLCHAWKLDLARAEAPLKVMRFQIGFSREWIRRNQNLPEMEVHYAIISLLLLQSNISGGVKRLTEVRPDLLLSEAWDFINEWRTSAIGLLHNLGRRALRSAHIEIIWQDWLSPLGRESGGGGDLRRRLLQLEAGLSSSRGELLREIQQFCHAVDLRQSLPGHVALLPLASALRRASGDIRGTDILLKHAKITNELVHYYHAVLPVKSDETPRRLPPMGRLKAQLDLINAQAVDLTFLDPLTIHMIEQGPDEPGRR